MPPERPLPWKVLDSVRQLDRVADALAEVNWRVLLDESDVDKYSVTDLPVIDCANRIAFCKAACCRLNVILTPQDLDEGIIVWDREHPYLNVQHADGYCSHFEHGTCGCTVYAHRPLTCRMYDCRRDPRVWIDFEKRIPNPALEQPGWPQHVDG
jgi:hypothetical protein